MSRLRRLADLTQEGLAERSRVSVDVVRKLEQRRKHSARLPTLYALAKGLVVELTSLLGNPPGVPSNGEADPPTLVAVRRAITPPLFAPSPEPVGAERLSLSLLRALTDGGFGRSTTRDVLRKPLRPRERLSADSRLVASASSRADVGALRS